MIRDLAIIGHGPSPVGEGYGQLIDSMDCVLRFHTCDLQDPIDYGTRYDYGVLPGPWGTDRIQRETIRLPAKAWLVYLLHNQRRPRNYPDQVFGLQTHVEEEEITRLLGDMELPPTRGLCAILLAAYFLKPENIWLVGFDSLLLGRVMQYHEKYDPRAARMPEEYIGQIRNARHDFEIENKKLQLISEEYNIQIRDIAECHMKSLLSPAMAPSGNRSSGMPERA